MRVSTSTSGGRPPSLISHPPWRLTSAVGMLVPENMGIAVRIALLSCVQAEIRVRTLCDLPSWISDFRFHLAVLPGPYPR